MFQKESRELRRMACQRGITTYGCGKRFRRIAGQRHSVQVRSPIKDVTALEGEDQGFFDDSASVFVLKSVTMGEGNKNCVTSHIDDLKGLLSITRFFRGRIYRHGLREVVKKAPLYPH